MGAEARDDLPRIVQEYDNATFLESIATREEDKRKLRKTRSFLLTMMGVLLAGVIWH